MVVLAALLLVVFVVAPSTAHAQGFGIYEHGACMMARGATGVALPCDDGSAIAVNPAGIVGPEGFTIGLGGLVVVTSGGFDGDDGVRGDLERSAAVPPFAYVLYGASPRLAFGAGLYVPYGLGVEWPLDFAGRFVSFDTELRSIYVQPSVAYAISDWFSVGGGPTIVVSSVELNRREDLAAIPLGTTGLTFGALVDPQTDLATTTLSASNATGVGVNVGALARLHERVRVGARYMSAVEVSYDGDVTFAPVGGEYRVTRPNPLGLPVGAPIDNLVAQVLANLPDQGVRTKLEMPAQFVVGASVRVAPRVTLLADYQWVGWSAFDAVELDFANPSTPDERLIQNYDDTSAFRLGTELEMTQAFRLRAGYAHTQAAAPDETVTPLLPEARRNHATVGFGWTPRPGITIDVAYQFVAQADRRGRTVSPPRGVPPSAALNNGLYSFRADLIGFMVTFRP